MERTTALWTIREGAEVVGADGDKVGEVIAVNANAIVVEKGFFFPSDYTIPMRAVAGVEGDRVRLTVTKDEALNQSWGQDEADLGYGTQTGAFGTGASGFVENDDNLPPAQDPLTGITPNTIGRGLDERIAGQQ